MHGLNICGSPAAPLSHKRRREEAACDGLNKPLDHAEHDGADEGDGEVRGDNAQFPGKGHEVAPCTRAPWRVAVIVNRKWRREKVSLAVARAGSSFGAGEPVWLKNTEINVLKSL
jgi:hypothetical protein